MSDPLLGQSALPNRPDDEGKSSRRGPYENSLIGKYSRMLLLLVTLPLLVWLVQLAIRQHLSLVSLVAAIVLLASLLSSRGVVWLRVFLLAAMTFNVFSAVINPNDVWDGTDAPNPLAIPNLILAVCLMVATVFEIGNLLGKSDRQTSIKFLWWGLLAIPAIGYIVATPLVSSLWEATVGEASNSAAKDPDWTMPMEMAFRAAKFLVFVIFTYLGACIGSFLNVVAYCVPRGESVGMRDSSCPKCKMKISRMDNLPVFSYINLSARCRACRAPIPARYLIVELLVATIFGSLFLYELVTGARNIPSMQGVSHAGILWIILYPKWNIISIYFFHCFFMSFLMVLSLIEWDRQKLALRFSIGLVLSFLIPATVLFSLQPIPAPGFLSSLTGSIPAVSQFAKLAFGGLVGAAVAGLIGAVIKQPSHSTLIPAMALAGIVLGWQSVLHVSVLLVLLLLVVRFVPRLRGSLPAQPTFLLLIAVMIHHPIWKIVFEQISV